MEQSGWELNLYEISRCLIYNLPKDEYNRYGFKVASLLSSKRICLWEDEILKEYGKSSMDEVQAESKFRYYKSVEKQRDQQKVRTWFDTLTDYVINPQDHLYTHFFAYRMRHLDLMEIDPFLDYQLAECYEGNFSVFSRFLTLLLRKHADVFTELVQVQTIQEWIALRQQQELKQDSIPDENTLRIKGRPKRTADDKLTALNQEQIVLLIHYLKNAKAFYQGEYLTNKQAGQAFHILTGYSADTIRQKLANHELEIISNSKNLAELSAFLMQLQNLVESTIKAQTTDTATHGVHEPREPK